MDRIVLIAIAVAVIAVIGATLMLNPGGGGTTTKPAEPAVTPNAPEEPETDTTPKPPRQPAGNFTNATYGVQLDEFTGNCKLYQHVVTDRFQCFGTAGNYSTMVTNEYREATSEKYFCKGTVYGCKLYETVYIQPL